MPIRYWNRRHARIEIENVYGGDFVSLLYGNPAGFALTNALLVRKTISRLYGSWQNTTFSGRKVAGFMQRFGIEPADFEPGPFSTFNDFFIRRFRPGVRSFPESPSVMGAFAEARYFALADADNTTTLPVKGLRLSASEVLAETMGKERFAGGPCLLARLCPVDYHRFHFPDSGCTSHFHVETGLLHSVNPLALERKPDLFLANERHISVLETEQFGALAYVEVGALCVGRIVHTHPLERPFCRGGEKGYFLFGASTVIVYGEKGAWLPEPDLLEQSRQGIETLVELGQPVARATKKS